MLQPLCLACFSFSFYARKFNKEDAVDRSKWRKLIKDGSEWVNVSSDGTGLPGLSRTKGR